jgi:steroid delta-isomerase-like uncharacterized protein
MTTENKEIVRRCFQALNERDLDAAMRLHAADYVNHAAIAGAQDVAGARRIFEKLFVAMPDQRMTCEDLIAEGEKVVCRLTVEGTHTGPLAFANAPLPATNRSVRTEQIHVFRIAQGKIAEHWAGRDDIGMMRQLGFTPAVSSEKKS